MPERLAVTTNSRDLVEPHKYSNGSLVTALPGHVNALRGLTRTTHWTQGHHQSNPQTQMAPVHHRQLTVTPVDSTASPPLRQPLPYRSPPVQPVNSGGAHPPCANQPYHADARLPVTETENRRAPGAQTYSRRHTTGGARSPPPTNITLIDYAEPPLLQQPQRYVDTIKPSPNLHTS